MSSSNNIAARRIPARSRSTATSRDESSSKPSSTASSASGGGVAALRKRSALGDMTNAATRKAQASNGEAQSSGKTMDGAKTTVRSKIALRDSNGTTLARNKAVSTATAKPTITKPVSKPPQETTERTVRRKAVSAIPQRSKSTSTASTFSRSNSVQSDASRRTNTSSKDDRAVKKTKTDVGEVRLAPIEGDTGLVHKKTSTGTVEERPKDEGWKDLDAEDVDDPLMVAEYVNDIFEYMKDIELEYLPNGNYIDNHPEITWEMRGVLVDWLIDIHSKFRLVPETLFLAQNLVDRFLTLRTISLNKLQLVGLTAMFIAAKYEEVLCPSVRNFLYLAEGGYTDEEILKAERYMLKVLKFNLSYASPMNFLRRISKADDYDIQTRTVAKFFMEISLVDHRFLEHPPSVVAAAAVWNARMVLERGEWHPTLVHYSGYSVAELLPTAELMIDYCLRAPQHQFFVKKYSGKKFMRAATYVFEWGKKTYGDFSHLSEDDLSLRVDLFAQCGVDRPKAKVSSSELDSTADSSSQDPEEGHPLTESTNMV